jgi:hypothetical protein
LAINFNTLPKKIGQTYGITQVCGAVEGGREILTDPLALPGVQVIQGIDFNWALTFWPGQLQDFGDALVVAAVQVRKEAQVVTRAASLLRFPGRSRPPDPIGPGKFII